MTRVHVTYVVNGATMFDIIEARRVGIQRRKSGVFITFPDSDGRFTRRYSKVVTDEPASASWVTYSDCPVVFREEMDETAKVS